MSVAPDTYAPGVFLAGSEIPNADADHPPREQAIAWVRQTDGSLAAEIYSYESGGGGIENLYLRSFCKPDGSGVAETLILASQYEQAAGAESYVQALANGGSGGASVTASANSHVVEVINGDNSSSFVQTDNHYAANLSPALSGPFYNPLSPYTFFVNRKSKQAIIIGQLTCYTSTVGQVYYRMIFDGVVIGQQSFYFNETFEHHTMPMVVGRVSNVAVGNHTIYFDIYALSGGTPFFDPVGDCGAFTFIG